jgi:peptidoglycan/xylan/chitin deacetylase (PgdA/CDA1 family)
MYHSISELTAGWSHPYFETRTSPAVFRAQMMLLRDSGFTTLFPCEIAPWLKTASSNAKAVCLTFDDAYEDFLTAAFPVLQEFRFKSTVYVPTGLTGTIGLIGLKLLGWPQIRELAQAGVNFGSHTVTHPEMKTLSDSEVCRELDESKLSLEDALGQSIRDFSYPFAFPEHHRSYVEGYRRHLLATGYNTGMTTVIGSVRKSSDSLTMHRLPANDFDDTRFLAAKLNSSYDWLHQIQLSSKIIRQLA